MAGLCVFLARSFMWRAGGDTIQIQSCCREERREEHPLFLKNRFFIFSRHNKLQGSSLRAKEHLSSPTWCSFRFPLKPLDLTAVKTHRPAEFCPFLSLSGISLIFKSRDCCSPKTILIYVCEAKTSYQPQISDIEIYSDPLFPRCSCMYLGGGGTASVVDL